MSGPFRIDTAIAIAAPPRRVWALLTDFAGYGGWNPWIVGVTGALAQRAVLALKSVHAPGGEVTDGVVTLVSADFPEMCRDGGHPDRALLRGERRFRCAPAGAGCRFHLSEQVSIAEGVGPDREEHAYRLLGNAHENVLTAFEATLKAVYLHAKAEAGVTPAPEVGNDFQNIDKARKRLAELSLDPFADLDDAELSVLELNIQKRHIIGHNLGIMDELPSRMATACATSSIRASCARHSRAAATPSCRRRLPSCSWTTSSRNRVGSAIACRLLGPRWISI